MNWIGTRPTIVTIAIITILALAGLGGGVGVSITASEVFGGFTWAHLLLVGQAFILFAFWKRYI